jgi:hypothetical protein
MADSHRSLSAVVLIDDLGNRCYQVRCTRCEHEQSADATSVLTSLRQVAVGRPPGWVGWTPAGFDAAAAMAERHVWQHRLADG